MWAKFLKDKKQKNIFFLKCEEKKRIKIDKLNTRCEGDEIKMKLRKVKA